MIARIILMVSLALALPAHADMRGSTERIQRFLKVAAQHPGDPAPLVELGANYAVRYTDTHHKGDKQDAEKYLQAALAIDPKLAAPGAWRGLMRCSEARGKMSFGPAKEGLGQIDEAIAKQPDNLDLRVLRASVDLELPGNFNRSGEALADLQACLVSPEKARQWDLDLSEIHLKIGKCFRAKGDLAHARSEWEAAVKANALSPEGQEASRLLVKYRN